MILVDSSVLIDYLAGRKALHVEKLEAVLSTSTPYGITSHIYQEVLQGARTKKDFARLSEYLSTVRIYEPLDMRGSYSSAARIFFRCRKEGVTVRSTIDCLIVQICLEHKLRLLHNDRDFDRIRGIAAELEVL